MKNALRGLVLASLLCFPVLTTTSCNGPFRAFNGLSEWNDRVTDQDWINTAIFWGLWIIPVYQFATLGDLIIFNPIEYWTGDSPLGDLGGRETRTRRTTPSL